MTKHSLARLNYELPEHFKLIGREQKLYTVDVATFPINDHSENELWEQQVNQIKKSQLASNKPIDTLRVDEISTNFPAVFYFANKSFPNKMTVEAQRLVGQNIVWFKLIGKKGMDDKMKRLITIISESYQENIDKGFNIGAGSFITEASVNEEASVTLKDNETNCELTIDTETAGSTLNDGPMDEIDDEIKWLKSEGIKLKVLNKQSRTAAGFSGEDALISIKDPEQSDTMLRYSWFYAGVTADAYQPEIRVQFTCPIGYQKQATKIWNGLIDPLSIRG